MTIYQLLQHTILLATFVMPLMAPSVCCAKRFEIHIF